MKIVLILKAEAFHASIVMVTMFSLISFPSTVHAGFLSFLSGMLGTETYASEETVESHNSQTLPLLEPSITPELKVGKNDTAITIVEDQALESNNGPLGPESDGASYFSSDERVNIYSVKEGDTLKSIAKEMKVTEQAIIYANNDIPRAELTKPGQVLIILPLKGAIYTIKKGDTASSISAKFKVSVDDIVEYNVLESATDLKIGDQIILPGVDASALQDKPATKTPTKSTPKIGKIAPGKVSGGYIWPFPAGVGRVSQGMHDGQAIDIAAPSGTPIYAVQSGTVLAVKSSGYNGGYGKYVIINFDDGKQAIFAHMSQTAATPGQRVAQGQVIGYVGTTGRSTGNHLHMEFRATSSPYAGLRVNMRALP